jgi:hypothetical protein
MQGGKLGLDIPEGARLGEVLEEAGHTTAWYARDSLLWHGESVAQCLVRVIPITDEFDICRCVWIICFKNIRLLLSISPAQHAKFFELSIRSIQMVPKLMLKK